jgi:hypothetical protein
VWVLAQEIKNKIMIKAIPYVITAILGAGIAVGIIKFTQPTIQVTTEKIVPQPCNGIDYDKIKSKNLTIENTQVLTVNGDSTLLETFRKIVKEEMQAANVVKCKR